MPEEYVVYCDEISDELLAEEWLREGRLKRAEIRRLPPLATCPAFLKDLLAWERQDWIIVKDTQVICTVEFSRHGYTGDNGFQRFARLYRAASLGLPNIYFTPFSRSRTNELEMGTQSERNVAPELFKTLMLLSEEFGVPCLALAWPTDDSGTAIPMTDPRTRAAMSQLRDIIMRMLEGIPLGPNTAVEKIFPDTIGMMKRQADIPFRGTETRREISLPIVITNSGWLWEMLPSRYFAYGKADKALASLALRQRDDRPLVGSPQHFWEAAGRAWVLYLGYQWRPDPASGLVALAAAWARRFDMPLIVAWPRVFLADGADRAKAMAALEEFKQSGTGPLLAESQRLGFDSTKRAQFRDRLSVSPDQYGVFARNSKIGRILRETAQVLILGDAVVAP